MEVYIMTNANKIRQMTNDELISFLFNLQLESYVAGGFENEELIRTEDEWEKWLNQDSI